MSSLGRQLDRQTDQTHGHDRLTETSLEDITLKKSENKLTGYFFFVGPIDRPIPNEIKHK